MVAHYAFVSRWRLPVPAARAWEELEGMLRPRADFSWWPGVQVDMPPRRLAPGERLVMSVRTPLGYRLRMLLTITDVDPPRAIAAAGDGDLRGIGRIVVAGDPPAASVVTIHWDVATRRRWMNATAWALRPAFTWAHAHVMRRGGEGLARRLGPARSDLRNAGNSGVRDVSGEAAD